MRKQYTDGDVVIVEIERLKQGGRFYTGLSGIE